MEIVDWLRLAVFLGVIVALTKPLGLYLYQVLSPKEKTFLDFVFKPIEKGIYRACGVNPLVEQTWKEYLFSIFGFTFVSIALTSLVLALQYYLPFNPQKIAAPSWDTNLNISISFVSNTDWQSYSGETAMSYFSQMFVLTVQNFASAAVGLGVAAVLARAISRQSSHTVGNFWADLVRINLYLLLPIAIVSAGFLISEGVPQNFNSYVQAETLEGVTQTIVQGPMASQETIKMLGTNGGGFTNANSAHPYENPTVWANLIEMLLILLIPAAQIYYFGKTVGDIKHSWYVFAALAFLFIGGVWICHHAENVGNPEWAHLDLVGGNWEGKEQRFGIFCSSLFSCVTTVVACGAVNCALDSMTPFGGFIPLLNMQLTETIFGGVGAGLYSIILYIFLAVFLSGLIIGRTPKYLGKKIEAFDIKMVVLALLPYVLVVHLFTAWSCFSEWGIKALGNSGPHGFSEMLFAFSSCAANNGSAFAGLSANNIPYNLTTAAAMLLGRFLVITPVMALAGSLAQKKIHPKNPGSFPVSSWLFTGLLVGVVLLIGALTFLPALTMGPILEQFFMAKGKLFP